MAERPDLAMARTAIIGARAAVGRHRLPGILAMADMLEEALATVREQAEEIERLREALLGAPTPDYALHHPMSYREWFRGEGTAALNRATGEKG